MGFIWALMGIVVNQNFDLIIIKSLIDHVLLHPKYTVNLLVLCGKIMKCLSNKASICGVVLRSIGTTPCLGKDEEPGFLSKLISGNPKLTTQSHSSVLSDKKEVYELQGEYSIER